MPIENGEFIGFTEEEIYNSFENNLEARLNASSEPGDLVTSQLRAEAETLADMIEDSLQRVYYASYLEDANGEELNKLVSRIGLSRQKATSATGTVQFMRDSPPKNDYTIPRGALIQTGGSAAIEYKTTEKTKLAVIDDFESNDLSKWSGDTAPFNTANASFGTQGDHVLDITQNDSTATIVHGDAFKVGTRFSFDMIQQQGAAAAFQFGRQDNSNYFELRINASTNTMELVDVVGGVDDSSASTSTSMGTLDQRHVEIEWQLYGDIIAKIYESKNRDNLKSSVFLGNPDRNGENKRNVGSFAVRGSNVNNDFFYADNFTTTATTANIEAINGGVETNVSSGAINIIQSKIAGAESVTNHVATGDSEYVDTNSNLFVVGENRETDEELRDRAFENTSIGGAATAKAIGTKIQKIDGVQSVSFFKNKTESSKNGLPAHSFEPVVYGGADKDIAQAIFDASSIDSTDFGGAHGTEVTYDIESDFLASTETIHWSRPDKLDLEIEVDLIIGENYASDDVIRSLIVDYIGGTDVDGSFVTGTAAGEDVYEAVLKQNIIGPNKTGVWEVDSLLIDGSGDGNFDGNDDTETLSSGADVLAVTDSEVAQVNASDASIVVNTTER